MTSPVAAKREPWQGQSQVRSAEFHSTMQPRWVQRADISWSLRSSSRYSAALPSPASTIAPSPFAELPGVAVAA